MNISELGKTKLEKSLLSIKPIHIVGFLVLLSIFKYLNENGYF